MAGIERCSKSSISVLLNLLLERVNDHADKGGLDDIFHFMRYLESPFSRSLGSRCLSRCRKMNL